MLFIGVQLTVMAGDLLVPASIVYLILMIIGITGPLGALFVIPVSVGFAYRNPAWKKENIKKFYKVICE